MQHPALERKKSFKRISKKGSSSDYYTVGSRDDSDQLPTFFFNCVSFLEEHALDEEGILRIHGRSQDTTAINAYLASGDSNTTLSQVDPHAVATLLKSYLSQGPPLLPMEHYSTLIEIGGKKEPEGEEILSLRDIVASTPLSFQRVLHRLLIFIDNVQHHSGKSKMDIRALSVIFNPILLRAPTSVSPAQILSQTQSCISLITLLLKNYQTIFEGLGLNSTEMPLSPPVPTRDGNLQGGSSVIKDKVKVRFLFNFSVKTGGSIQNTVSLFLKWAKQGKVKRRETGQTNALVCTNPQEVDWDEVIPLEVTLAYNKRLKIFEPRSLVVTLKNATPKGSKTFGAATINLAELIPLSLQTSPREEEKTYEMAYRGAKSKGLVLQVKSHSEWRKVNNKLVVRQDTGSLSRRFGLSFVSEKMDKASAAQKSMPNLNNLETHNDDDSKHPLSAREHYSESALNVSALDTNNDSFSSANTTPTSSPPVSPSLAPTLPPTLAPSPRENQNTQSNNNNNILLPVSDFSVINSPRLVSPRFVGSSSLSPIQTSTRNNLSLDLSPSISISSIPVSSPIVSPVSPVSSPISSPSSSSISAPIPIPLSSPSTLSPRPPSPCPSPRSLSPSPALSPSPRPPSVSINPSLSNSISSIDSDNNTVDVVQGKESNPNETTVSVSVNGKAEQDAKEKDKDSESEKHSDKESESNKAKEDIRSNSDSSDYNNKSSSNSRPQIILSSPEPHDSPTPKKEKKLSDITLTNLDGSPLTSVRPSLSKEFDPYISDGESDNEFDGHNAYTSKLLEQIEHLQQQRRQLELETFNLRKFLLHNEIYRPQTLEFSERGIASTAEQIIENLFKMNCFQEPQNFLPSFFDSIIISLQQESKNEVELPKILYWLSTTLGLLYLLRMSLKGIPDPSILGVVALTRPIKLDMESADEYERSNANLFQFASGVQRTGLELYNRVLKLFIEELDEEKLVLAFLGRPKEKEEKRNFVIKEKPFELSAKTPEPILTPKMAIKEVVQEISENYELIREAKIFENFAWHLVMHRIFCLDHRLVSEMATQKKLFSTDAQAIKQAATDVEQILIQKFPTQTISNPMKITTQYINLVTAEYSKMDSETFISNSFTHFKPSQILQILEVLRPDKDSRKPVPASVQKILQNMAKSENEKPSRVSPMTWHLNDDHLPSLS